MRARSSLRTGRFGVLVALLIAASAPLAGAAAAEPDSGLAPRFDTISRGTIDVVGGASVDCDAGPCRAVDADDDPTSANSGSAELAVVPGSSVEFAGLYWTGHAEGLERQFVRFAPPGSGYAAVFADDLDVRDGRYQAFADVTALVREAGGGPYAVADVATELRAGAGWALVVVTGADDLPARSLTVLDGLWAVEGGSSLGLGGFRTPGSGDVAAELALVAYGGGDGFDQVQFQDRPLWAAGRAPEDVFEADFDIAALNGSGRLGNRATNGRLDISTTDDSLTLGVVTAAIEVSPTDIAGSRVGRSADAELSAARGGGEADLRIVTFASPSPYVPGQALFVTIQVGNDGPDPVVGATVSSPAPVGTTDLTWSCSISSGIGSCSDDGGGDDIALGVDLEPGAMVVIEAMLMPPTDGSPVTVVASVEPPEGVVDPGPAPNEAGVVVSPGDGGDGGEINLPPVANDDETTVSEGGVVRVDVLANDSDPDNELDPTSVRVLEPPGIAEEDPETGEIVFDIEADFVGSLAAVYSVCDVGAACAEATVTVNVTGGEPLPETGADVDELAQLSGTLFVLGALLVGFGRRRFAR